MRHLLNHWSSPLPKLSQVALIFVASALAACEPSALEQAERAWAEGAHAQAVDLYRSRPGLLGEKELQHYAISLAKTGHVQQAANILSELPTDNLSVDGQLALIRAEIFRGEFEAPETKLKVLLSAHPQNVDVQVAWGECLAYSGRLPEANTVFSKALKAEPNSVEALIGLGDIAFSEMAVERATQYYQQALEIAGTSANGVVVRTRLARLLNASGDRAAADALLAETRFMMPEHPVSKAEVGKSLARMGFLQEALPLLQEAQVALGDDAELLYYLGFVFLKRSSTHSRDVKRMQDLQSAQMWFSRAVERDPARFEALEALGQVKVGIGDYEGAKEAYTRAYQGNPKRPDALIYLGRMYAEQGMLPQAEAAFAKGLTLAPDNVFLQINLGVLALRQEKVEEADKWLNQGYATCQKTAPDHQCRPEASYQLARLAGKKGDAASGVTHLLNAFSFGFSDLGRLMAEADLEVIRKDIQIAIRMDAMRLRISN